MRATSLNPPDSSGAIAIIGIGGRFPGAPDIQTFWQNLLSGVESIACFSDAESLADGVDPSILRQPGYVNARGVIDGAELFDARFFGFSPRQATILDPQHRLFLECAWEVMESAGYAPGGQSCGVFAGCATNDYAARYGASTELTSLEAYEIMLANERDFLATRIAYKLDLRGPAVVVQAACATSLVAVVSACESLLRGQCEMALAGGVNIDVPSRLGHIYHPGGVGSPDGHCRPFDASANGMVGGNGVGLVLLKRLEGALADGDIIHAVIRGGGLNNDGADKVGFTAPSIAGQANAIAMAQAAARVSPETISYVECHGTGTPLGDPIEIAALADVFGRSPHRAKTCVIGSVKSNIGHLGAAAGIAGLIKAVLALKHEEIPPSLYFRTANPEIDLGSTPFFVNSERTPWPRTSHPRRAAVSSFGIGGTNAHVVLEEAPPRERRKPNRRPQVIVVSAATPDSLDRATENLVAHLRAVPASSLPDVAHTLQIGRRAFPHRRAVACTSIADSCDALTQGELRCWTGIAAGAQRSVVFLFPGQGSQYAGMARRTYEDEPQFREELDRCAEVLAAELGEDIRTILLDVTGDSGDRINQTEVAQPALFCVEYALARTVMSWGVVPRALLGHSVGELVAAAVAGVMSRDDALRLVAARGRLMQQNAPGAMLSAAVNEVTARALARGGIAVAAINSHSDCVFSGPAEAVAQLEDQLRERGVAVHRLHTSHAFHSAMMEPTARAFREVVSGLMLQPAKIPIVSNLTGDWFTNELAVDPTYWSSQLRHTVRFSDGVGRVLGDPRAILFELGPGRTLTTLARKNSPNSADQLFLGSLPSASASDGDQHVLLTSIARLWTVGHPIDWDEFHGNQPRRRVELPTHPFERKRYWLEPISRGSDETAAMGRPTKISDVGQWFFIPSWTRIESACLPESHPSEAPDESLLVFGDETLCEQLAAAGQRFCTVVSVVPGPAFERLDRWHYRLPPGERSPYSALLNALDRDGVRVGRVIHAWNVQPPSSVPVEPTVTNFHAAQERCFYSLVWLCQALGAARPGIPVHVNMLVSNHFDVIGEECVAAERATVVGACRCISTEYPNMQCRVIDIASPSGSDGRAWAESVLAESFAGGDRGNVAYRAGRWWMAQFRRVVVPSPGPQVSLLKQEGVYLITGGLGNIGLLFAEFLGSSKHARLSLVSRSPLPAREEWDRWLATHRPDDPVVRKILAIRRIERAGGQVLVISADIGDPVEAKRAVDATVERFGHLTGIIHGAANTNQLLQQGLDQLDRDVCEAHFRAKALGALNLWAAAGSISIDCWILLSSISTVLGGFDSVAYAAANSFLDAFAVQQATKGKAKWFAIGWDGWDFERTATEERASSKSMLIAPREGVDALQRILERDLQAVIVSTGDLDRRLAYQSRARASTSLGPKANEEVPAEDTSVLRDGGPDGDVQQTIADIWKVLLGVDDIDAGDDFFALGGDSLLAVQVAVRIREALHVDIPIRFFFDSPTIAQLAAVAGAAQGKVAQ